MELSQANTVKSNYSIAKKKLVHYPRRQTPKPQPKNKCFKCVYDFPHVLSPCPAVGKTCGTCKKKNHYTRGRSQRTPQITHKHGARTIHARNEITSNNSDDDDDGYVYYMDGREKKRDKNLTVTVKIQKLKLECFVDTGASINILDEKSWTRLNKNNLIQLHPSNVKVYAYGASKPLKILGKFETEIESDRKITLRFSM